MPQRVCFHVGLPKTGSTTVQIYLRGKEEQLRTVGILYPGEQEHHTIGAHANHPAMLNAMMGKSKAPSDGLDVQGCRAAVAHVFEKFHESELATIIWSYEAMGLSAGHWDADYLEKTLHGADVRIVCFVRYIDDWLTSLYKQKIWARARPRARLELIKPLRPFTIKRRGTGDATERPSPGILRTGGQVSEALRSVRQILPGADLDVRSFDANREQGKVVSGALEALGVPVDGVFADADTEAGVRNPTNSDMYTMLLYHLQMAQAAPDLLHDIHDAARRRDRQGGKFAPLSGRRFRLLGDEAVAKARAQYEALRQEYPSLPEQPPLAPKPGDWRLSRDEAVGLMDWLRPDISDDTFDRARAAYPLI